MGRASIFVESKQTTIDTNFDRHNDVPDLGALCVCECEQVNDQGVIERVDRPTDRQDNVHFVTCECKAGGCWVHLQV